MRQVGDDSLALVQPTARRWDLLCEAILLGIADKLLSFLYVVRAPLVFNVIFRAEHTSVAEFLRDPNKPRNAQKIVMYSPPFPVFHERPLIDESTTSWGSICKLNFMKNSCDRRLMSLFLGRNCVVLKSFV